MNFREYRLSMFMHHEKSDREINTRRYLYIREKFNSIRQRNQSPPQSVSISCIVTRIYDYILKDFGWISVNRNWIAPIVQATVSCSKSTIFCEPPFRFSTSRVGARIAMWLYNNHFGIYLGITILLSGLSEQKMNLDDTFELLIQIIHSHTY